MINAEHNIHPIQFVHQNEQKIPNSHDNPKNQEYYVNPSQQYFDNFQTSKSNYKNFIGETKPIPKIKFLISGIPETLHY